MSAFDPGLLDLPLEFGIGGWDVGYADVTLAFLVEGAPVSSALVRVDGGWTECAVQVRLAGEWETPIGP